MAIEAIHTVAWFSIEACMLYLLSAGWARRFDRRAALAAVVVGGESLIFAAKGTSAGRGSGGWQERPVRENKTERDWCARSARGREQLRQEAEARWESQVR